MKKILILIPIFSNVNQEWSYDLFDECDYTARNLYEAQQWIKRYNRYANENLTIRTI